MRAPGFWSNPPDAPGLAARLLAPAASIWGLGARLRRAGGAPARAAAPVICVGNATAGGAGKTPVVLALLQALALRGVAGHALSRGHGGRLGGRLTGPHRVDPARDGFRDVGDEPLLLSAFAPTWVARDRAAGAAAAIAAGAQVVVMDDGFQNPSLAKDLSLLVVDAGQGFGNGRLIPAGPLREPVSDALARADAVVLIGGDAAAARAMARHPEIAASGAPVLRARLEPLATGLDLRGARVVAFAGIGRPEKFFDTLRAMGAELVATHGFADHAPYPPALLRRLLAEARAQGATLATTEKDAARLPRAFLREVCVAPVRLRFDDPAALDALLDRALSDRA
ncbi:MAG: tetraacyldisaccharide 4'-kinase [Rubrimonas sp.]|uniref:tetraacyldisaccharide 4'-kinase n=1 Tax=Rubrimonas sp. TaxID=2036015 RepID=UPI002FDCD2D9